MLNWRNDTMNYFQKLINKIKKIKWWWRTIKSDPAIESLIHQYLNLPHDKQYDLTRGHRSLYDYATLKDRYFDISVKNKDLEQKIRLKQLVDRETVSEFIIDVNLYERLNERITSELYNRGSLNIEEYTIITKQFLSELDDEQYQNIKKRGVLV